MGIIVKEVTSKKDVRVFMDFANELYKDSPHYVPPMWADELKQVSKKHNFNLAYSDQILLLAYRGETPIGRVRGIVNHKFNETSGYKHLRFDHYDVIDDVKVTIALFDELVKWGKTKGMTELNGPIGFNDLDKQGLLIDGFEHDGMLITNYNHAYYKKHLKKIGLVKDCDWVEYQVMLPEEVNPRLTKIANRILSRNNIRLMEFKNKKELRPYLYRIFETYNEAFAPLHGFVELTQDQIDQYVKQYLPVMNLDYIKVLVDSDDKVAGFGVLGPSFSDAMRKSKGRLFPFGFIHVLKAMRNPKVLDMYLVAVRPELQGTGLNSILMSEITKNAIKNGILYAETGPELENNEKVQSQWKNYDAKFVRRRRCFIKKI